MSETSPYLRALSLTLHRIIPQAVSVRYGLAIGAKCAPVVLTLMYLFGMFSSPSLSAESLISTQAPIAWPIAKLLDRILGASDTHTYKKAELKSVV